MDPTDVMASYRTRMPTQNPQMEVPSALVSVGEPFWWGSELGPQEAHKRPKRILGYGGQPAACRAPSGARPVGRARVGARPPVRRSSETMGGAGGRGEKKKPSTSDLETVREILIQECSERKRCR